MNVEVRVLEGFGQKNLRKRWMQLWDQVGDRILSLPKREQHILLEDFRTAIESRILIMERINDANRNR
jgi:hypothetical protein